MSPAGIKKTADFICGTPIEAAFVSTNSICQGEHIPILWPYLINKYGIKINFAHQSFKWWNEAKGKAAVYCVIVGFSKIERAEKYIFTYENAKGEAQKTSAQQINAYLIDAPQVIILKRTTPLCDVPKMVYGSKPSEGGHLILDEAERADLIKVEPLAKKYIRRFMGADEFINNKKRYCLWMPNIDPAELRKMPYVLARVKKVRDMRLKSSADATRQAAERPAEFFTVAQPKDDYLIFPEVTTDRRRYIPVGFMSKKVIVSNKCLVIPKADTYLFGVLTSSMHMIWTRVVSGRLGNGFQYSASMVYHTFPWPEPAGKQKAAIEKAAQHILDVRAQFPKSTLADLYDPLTMPPALIKAHQKLDAAVEKSYGKEFTNDADRVAHLFYLYEKLNAELFAKKARRKNI